MSMNRNQTIETHYKKNYKRLVKHMTNRVPDNSPALAEEVVMEAYARALAYWESYDPTRGEFSTWFNRIMNNACAACIRDEQGTNLSMDDDDLDLEPYRLMQDIEIPFHIIVLIQSEMNKQRPEVKEVLNMFFNLGMKTREIAECVDYNHGNIRQIVRRFRIKFEDENTFRTA